MGFRSKYQLVPTSEQSSDDFGVQQEKISWLRRRFSKANIAIHGLLILSNLLFIGLWLKGTTKTDSIRPQLIYSPAKRDQALSYEKRRLWRDIEHNKYAGDPRPEFDQAWRELIEPMSIKISKEEADQLGDETIPLLDGSGYVAELAVYHELHCIKRIRRHFHLDRYYPNMSDEDRRIEDKHIDHCLEYWREAAMCRGDTALATFRWGETAGMPYSRVYSDHECVNWDRLDTWARGRMVNMSDYSQFGGHDSGHSGHGGHDGHL